MRELSSDTQTALEQIAAGWGRVPSLAHPECLCGRRGGYSEIRYVEMDDRIYVVRPWSVKYLPCPIHPKGHR